MSTKWKKYVTALIAAKEYVTEWSAEQLYADEILVVPFPTLAIYDPEQSMWSVQVRAWLYAPFQNKKWKDYFKSLMQRVKKRREEKALEPVSSKADNEKKTFVARWTKKEEKSTDDEQEDNEEMFRVALEDLDEATKDPLRLGLFFVSNQVKVGAKSIINGVEHLLQPSDESGFIEQNLFLSEKEIFSLATPIAPGSRDLQFAYQIQPHEPKKDGTSPQSFYCTVYILASHGVSVISDIDDTIKISNVLNPHACFKSTFCESFEPVPGMSEVYRQWSEQHCQFHYVSASPWQLYPALNHFLQKYRYPLGTMNLRKFSWSLKFFKSPDTYKTETIAQMICAYPYRQYICVGDSGELDPEIYARLYQIFPHNICHIFIRDLCLTSECSTNCKERYQKVFAEVPNHRWTIFKDAKQIEKNIQKLLNDSS